MTFEDKIERGSFTGTTSADVVEVSLPSMSAAMVQLTGTFSATTTFEVLVDEGSSPTWKAISATNVTSGVAATTATAAGVYSVSVAGARRFRARCSTFVSGTVVVAVNVSRGVAAGSSSGGGGGGGASTIADGADVAEGTTTDAGVVTDTTGTVIGFLRGNIIKWISQLTLMGAVTEAAPASDTASSGLNGRLQRIAQRITSLIALVPAALTGSGNFKTSIAESTATVTVAGAKTNNNAAPGATNAGVIPALANAAAPSWTEGNQVATSVDLTGFQRGIVHGTTAGGASATGVNPVLTGFVGTGATIRNWTASNSVTATAGNDVPGVGPLVYDTSGALWNRQRDTNSADNSSGTGVAGSGLLGWDGSVYRRVSTNASGQLVNAASKAEDAGHTSGDTGMFALAVRQDTQSGLAGTTLDYIPFTTDANGSLRGVTGGYSTVLTSTLTRPNDTTAYAAGDEMTDTGGAIQTITGAARFSGGSGIIQGIYISQSTLWTTKPQMEIWVYDTTSTPVADNGAFAPTDGVTDTCIAVIPVTATYAGTVNQALDSGLISVPFVTSGSANLFFRIVIRNAAQDSAVSGVTKFRFRILQD
jgi:hypothetical protein